jgi:hypothetical protein
MPLKHFSAPQSLSAAATVPEPFALQVLTTLPSHRVAFAVHVCGLQTPDSQNSLPPHAFSLASDRPSALQVLTVLPSQAASFGEQTSVLHAPSKHFCAVAAQSVVLSRLKPSAEHATSFSPSQCRPGVQTQGLQSGLPPRTRQVVLSAQATGDP